MILTDYVFDSSFLIKLHRDQPMDIYVALWDRIADLLASGRAVVPREAFREIDNRDDELRVWLRDREALVVETSAERARDRGRDQRASSSVGPGPDERG